MGLSEGRQLLNDLGFGLAYSRGEVPSALYLVYLVVLHPLSIYIYIFVSVRANLCAPQLISRDNLSDPKTFGCQGNL